MEDGMTPLELFLYVFAVCVAVPLAAVVVWLVAAFAMLAVALVVDHLP